MIHALFNRLPVWLRNVLERAALAQTILLTAFGLVLANPLWRTLLGDAGYTAALVTLGVVAAGSTVARSGTIDWTNALPLSVALMFGWTLLSLVWSYQPLESAWRVTSLLATGFLGLVIAWSRDTIHIVRGLGTVLRVLLLASLGGEIMAWLTGTATPTVPWHSSQLADGVFDSVVGARGSLAFLCLVALVTFGIELRTRSVSRLFGWGSFALAGGMLVIAGSPISFFALVVVVAAAGAILVLRRSSPQVRWRWNAAFTGAGIVAVIGVWLARVEIISLLDGRGETSTRVHVWQEMSRYLFNRPLTGWGYSGGWWVGGPYSWVQQATDKTLANGMSAYIDVYFQLGAVGLVLFVMLIGTALVRSWMLAANRRSVIYVWPAMMMATLVVISVADSFVLTGSGFLILVIAAVKSARELTWGEAWRSRVRTELPSRAGR